MISSTTDQREHEPCDHEWEYRTEYEGPHFCVGSDYEEELARRRGKSLTVTYRTCKRCGVTEEE